MRPITAAAAALAATFAFAAGAQAATFSAQAGPFIVASTDGVREVPAEAGQDLTLRFDDPDGFLDVLFTATDALVIPEFAIAATGANGGSDINNTSIQLLFSGGGETGGTFSTPLVGSSGVSSANAIFPTDPITLAAGEAFTLRFLDNDGANAEDVQLVLTFDPAPAGDTPVIPLPAGLPLLLSALAVGGFVARRRKA